MATTGQAMPDQGAGTSQQAGAGAPPQAQGQGGGTPPSQGPANQIQQLLGNWATVAQQIAQAYPNIASQMNKIVQAIGEAQTAMITPSQPSQTSQQPMY